MTLPIEKAQIAKTTAQWAAAANVIGVDVIGIEVMNNGYNRYKRGDGVTAWASLPYLDKIFNQSSYSAAEIDAAVAKVINGLAIADGGTGASDAYQALLNLGAAAAVHSHATSDLTAGTLPVARGGTGVTSLTALLAALGIKDYVCDEGTGNGWYYRKWQSGKCELWKSAITGVSGPGTQWGNGWHSEEYGTALPFPLISCFYINGEVETQVCFMSNKYYAPESNMFKFRIFACHELSSADYPWKAHVVGTWR